ncbi:phenylalanine--tRNA ligase subunit beta [Catenulispora rubra]|uniref:phenylalanine--tRNA ligase subunit beta n=1 Tax=Catenulispora rubra TaxID=280293 RepID=UPI00189279BB|nr:phenylalanine--tRNA ligase subunit beta [Catenulispora rubra]
MKISLEWISDYVDLPAGLSAEQIAHDLTLKTVEVEDVVATPAGDLTDHILEIDNKSLTNRPDLWGHYGIARELATIYDVPLRALPSAPLPNPVDGLVADVDPALCQRMAAVNLAVPAMPADAPNWMRERLERIGEASVGLLVDISNYVMFTTGQPNHVYDSDAITLPLSARANGATSQTKLLSGPAELIASTPVIADQTGPVGVAGIMGGANSAVTPASRRFLIEAATFRPQPIRRASQQLGIRSEASARFEKGLDTKRVDQALALFLALITTIAPTTQLLGAQDVELEATAAAIVDVTEGFLAARIGTRLPDDEVRNSLSRLGFAVTSDSGRLRVIAPTWRSTGDISLPHDIVEEVARIHGYDNLPVAPLTVSLNTSRSLHQRGIDRRVREQLAVRCGMQEVVTYPWSGDGMLAATGWDKAGLVQFDGAPAPDHDTLRPSLVPNLLDALVSNLRYSSSFSIFEVGTVFPGGKPTPYLGNFEDMPPQGKRAAGVLVGADGVVVFRQLKGIVESLRRYAHLVDLDFAPSADAAWADRATSLTITAHGGAVGALALVSKRTRRLAGIAAEQQVGCFELNLALLSAHASRDNRYEKLSELPDSEFDLSVLLADDVLWTQVFTVVRGASRYVHDVEYVDEFRGSWVPEGHRSLTLRARLRPQDETLTAQIISSSRSAVLDALGKELGARLRDQ